MLVKEILYKKYLIKVIIIKNKNGNLKKLLKLLKWNIEIKRKLRKIIKFLIVSLGSLYNELIFG
jgi:hypothetical protein